jgi:hypothetical protein
VIVSFINICIQELEGILEDAEVDYKQVEDDLKTTEKEVDALELKLAEKVRCGLRSLSVLSDVGNIISALLSSKF